jgi:hypothetical protein
MLTADDFRDLALRLNGATERAHMGHPDFRAGGRIFANLHANEETASVKLTPEEQRELMRAYPAMFTPAAGAWGLQGWTVVRLQAAEEAAVRAAVLMAWQGVTSAPAPARRSKRPATPPKSPRKVPPPPRSPRTRKA